MLVAYARNCGDNAKGSFRVDDFVATGDAGTGVDTLVSFTAAFTAVCDGTVGALRGCVHYER